MAAAEILSRVAAELALFAGAGFLLFAINDLIVDIIYFARLGWREVAVYTRYPRAFADGLGRAKTLSDAVAPPIKPGFMAILVPAWDEASVIAAMLRATLSRLDYPRYTIFVGYYRNDPATLAAIASVKDARIEAVEVDADGPTTKADVAAGIRVRPIRSIPVWLTAERRQRLTKFGGGRNAFAFFAEGGVYDRPMPWGFTLDGYAQGGIVGLKSRDLFADGGVTFTHPFYRQFSAGLGVWGGVQPGLYRVDIGPRVTMKVRGNIRVHFDWRQRVAGNAQPGSGPAVTLSGNF